MPANHTSSIGSEVFLLPKVWRWQDCLTHARARALLFASGPV